MRKAVAVAGMLIVLFTSAFAGSTGLLPTRAELPLGVPPPVALPTTNSNEYHYEVLPGIQNSPGEPAANPRELALTCGWHGVCVPGYDKNGNPIYEKDGPGIDISAGVTTPVYAVFRHVSGDKETHVTLEYDDKSSCRKVDAIVNVTGMDKPAVTIRYTHTVSPDGYTPPGSRFTLATTPTGAITWRQVGQIARPLREVKGLTLQNLTDRGMEIENVSDRDRRKVVRDRNRKEIFRVFESWVDGELQWRSFYEENRTLVPAGMSVADLRARTDLDTRGLITDGNGVVNGFVWNSDNQPIYRVVDGVVKEVDRTEKLLWDGVLCYTSGAHLHQATHGPESSVIYKNKGTAAGFPSEDESENTGSGASRCFWSDTWIWKIKSSAGAPTPSDRSVDGAGDNSNRCPKRTLTVSVSGSGGTITSPSTKTSEHRPGKKVTITASPSSGYSVSWPTTGVASGNRFTVTMDRDRTVAVSFTRNTPPAPPTSPPASPSPPTGLKLSADGDDLNLAFTSSRAARFQLYKAGTGGAFCNPGASGCTPVKTVTATASASSVSFGEQPTGKYRARGQGCVGSACGAWSAFSNERTHTPPPPQCTLTVTVSPKGGGTVSGRRTLDCGTRVGISASANVGYRFDGWEGAGTGTGFRNILVDSNKSVTANFATVCTLTVEASPSSGGTTTPSAGTHTYSPCESSVSLKAKANNGYRFGSWSGTSSSTTVTLSAGDNKTVTASFVKQYYLWVTAAPSTCGSASGQGWHDPGARVPLTASVNDGCRFARWWGSGVADGTAVSTTSSSTTFKVPDATPTASTDTLSVVAAFAKQCTLTVTADTGGTVSGGGTYDCGGSRAITATASARYYFDRWSGSGIANTRSRSTTVTLSASKTVTAYFGLIDEICAITNGC